MKYRQLGATDLRPSVIGFGGFAIGGTDWSGTSDGDSRRALLAALDHGVNFFDTSDAYGWGRSEELIGEVLSPHRSEVLIATKGGVDTQARDYSQKRFDRRFLEASLDASLRRLRTDYIDLYQLHSPHADDLDDDVRRFVEDVAVSGRARYVGVSIADEASAWRAIELSLGSALQVFFNLLEQRLRPRVFPSAARAGVGIIARVPLYSGVLSGRYTESTIFPPDDHRSRWDPAVLRLALCRASELSRRFATNGRSLAQVALAFVLAHDDVATVIPGAKSAAQVKANVDALDVTIAPHEVKAMHEFYDTCVAEDHHRQYEVQAR